MASSPQQINPETKKRVYSLFGEYTRKNNLQFTGLLTGNNAVVAEHTSYRELAELVTNHVFGNEYRNKALAVMDFKGMADKIRNNHGTARPSFDRFLLAALIHFFDLIEKMRIHERSFLNRSAHYFFLRSTMNLLESFFG